MQGRWWSGWGTVFALGVLGCGVEESGQPKGPQDECTVRVATFESEVGEECEFGGYYCGRATAECIEGTPNTLGPCVCRRAATQPAAETRTIPISAGAFGGDLFYWATGVYGALGSAIVSTAAGEIVQAPGYVTGLRVADDTIYATDGSEAWAFSLTGEALPAPNLDVAFPPISGRVTDDEVGLYLDGAQVYERVRTFAETAVGVYVVPYSFATFVEYIDFQTPDRIQIVTMSADPFLQVWASGDRIYAVVTPKENQYTLVHADRSIIGTQK